MDESYDIYFIGVVINVGTIKKYQKYVVIWIQEYMRTYDWSFSPSNPYVTSFSDVDT